MIDVLLAARASVDSVNGRYAAKTVERDDGHVLILQRKQHWLAKQVKGSLKVDSSLPAF